MAITHMHSADPATVWFVIQGEQVKVLSKRNIFSIKRNIILLLLCIIGFGSYAVDVESKTVQVTGTGASVKEAISDGLIEAIGQVSGRLMEAESELANLEVAEVDNNTESYFSSQVFKDHIRTATKGAVKEYTVLEQGINDLGLKEVQLSVVCLKVIPGFSSRKKLVCGTFSFPGEPKPGIFDLQAKIDQVTGADKPARSIEDAFTDHLEAYFTQSRRFMVLNRRRIEDLAAEQNIILTGNVPIEEVLKVQFDNPADLIVAGAVESVDYVVSTRKMRSGRVIEIGEGFVEVSFRVLDVKSKQVKYSDRVRYTFTEGELRALSGSYAVTRAGNLMMSATADRIGKQILEAIYPLKVINVADTYITLNEGGRGIHLGQVYDVFALGEQQIDPYTKEKLGRLEIPVGSIRIVKSSAKMSAGRVVESEGEIPVGSICRLNVDQTSAKVAPAATHKKINTDDLF